MEVLLYSQGFASLRCQKKYPKHREKLQHWLSSSISVCQALGMATQQGSRCEMQPEQLQGIDNITPKHPQISLGGFRAILMKPVTS